MKSATYKTQFIVPTQAVGPVSPSRGYNSFDVTISGAKLHIVNTHLEAYDPATRLAQAQEAVDGPLKSARTTILLGDLNSGPDLPKPQDLPPYKAIADAGFAPQRTKVQLVLLRRAQRRQRLGPQRRLDHDQGAKVKLDQLDARPAPRRRPAACTRPTTAA